MESRRSVVSSIITAAMNAVNAHTSDDDDSSDFDSLLATTRNSFRRNSSLRGRKKNNVVKKSMILLRRGNADFFPTPNEISFLTKHGLGKKTAIFNRAWNITEIESYITSVYPEIPLDLVGFKLAKCLKNRKIVHLHQISHVKDLLDQVKQGILLVLPNRDLPLPEIQENTESLETANASQSTSATTISSSIIIPNTVSEITTTASSRTTVSNTMSHTTSASSNITVPNNVSQISSATLLNDILRHEELSVEEFDSNYPIDNILQNLDNISPVTFPHLPEDASNLCLQISRQHCVDQLLHIYKDGTVLDKFLVVTFEGENGSDSGGLTKELFNLFWRNIEPHYFRGEDCITPFQPLHQIRKNKENYVYLGRILSHMILLTQCFPSKISTVTFLLLSDPEVQIEKNVLIYDFLMLLTYGEKKVIKKALMNFSKLSAKEIDTVTNIFSSYSFYDIPKENDIEDQILAIAQDVLVDKPKELIFQMRKGIPPIQIESFWSKLKTENILKFTENQRPTGLKVISCLQTEDYLNNDETKVLHYLHLYLENMNLDALQDFLIFVTGSYIMPPYIQVQFTKHTGLSRRPITHTCANIIELSSFYNSYQDFKREMNLYLSSEYSFEYSNP